MYKIEEKNNVNRDDNNNNSRQFSMESMGHGEHGSHSHSRKHSRSLVFIK